MVMMVRREVRVEGAGKMGRTGSGIRARIVINASTARAALRYI